ncbi:restriction system-associated AAA family ATPase [Mucilaginibacter lacusdianchii]|uniref:restriction system-associated AAA family ATPase n=1 Tax=Mucilaginibacter lacusdianchii TaxID=2684211 RepID=UPI00131C6F34|nr:restriction system-associated AAA family ATPase [Mucilaginibacter sp. JXJ CY 39]
MKLLRLKLNEDFRSLQAGFEVHFLRGFDRKKIWDFMPYCLVGRNGSGKSNILEALAAIFYHMECIYLEYRPEDFEGEKNENGKVIRSGFFAEKCTPDAFEIEYLISVPRDITAKRFEYLSNIALQDEIAHVRITKQTGEPPFFEWIDRDELEPGATNPPARDIAKSLLPDYILGYSSGENEILSLPFFKMLFIQYDEYEDALREETGYAQPESRLAYLDAQHSQAVFLTNYLMQDEKILKPIYEVIGIKAITRFRIIINQSKKIPKYRFEDSSLVEEQSLGDKRDDFFELTSQLKRKNESLKDYKAIDKLRSCATSQFFDAEKKVLYLDYLIDSDKRNENGEILANEHGEQIGLSEMKKAFRAHFNEDPFELFRAFHILLTLNLYEVDRKTKEELYKSGSLYVNETVPVLASEKRIMRFKDFAIKKKGTRGEILSKSLSDGEHQYLHAMGICLLFKDTNSLFLLDEPETHFNPDWRAMFVSTLKDCLSQTKKRNIRELLITSHSPFIISDSHEENVLVFKKDNETGVVTADRPGFNTFGASVNQIAIEIFEREDTIGDLANSEITSYETRFREGENAENLVKEINSRLGDSVEKTILINRIKGFIKD